MSDRVAGSSRFYLYDRSGNTRALISARGAYWVDMSGPRMMAHTTGSLAAGKSQFLCNVNAGELVLKAAEHADRLGLWRRVGRLDKATVVFNRPIGVHARTGSLTNAMNVYRRESGLVHGAPTSPVYTP